MAMKVAGGEGPWCRWKEGAGDAPSQLPLYLDSALSVEQWKSRPGRLADFEINGAHRAEIMGCKLCARSFQYVSRANRGSFLPSAIPHGWSTLTTWHSSRH